MSDYELPLPEPRELPVGDYTPPAGADIERIDELRAYVSEAEAARRVLGGVEAAREFVAWRHGKDAIAASDRTHKTGQPTEQSVPGWMEKGELKKLRIGLLVAANSRPDGMTLDDFFRLPENIIDAKRVGLISDDSADQAA